MLLSLQDEFIKAAHAKFNFGDPSSYTFEGGGQQALVIGDKNSIFKIFRSSSTPQKISPHLREFIALQALGGYSGPHIKTPDIGKYKEFDTPLEMDGKLYSAMLEQSKLTGVRPKPNNKFQYADIGQSLAELHMHMKEQSNKLAPLESNIIERRYNILKDLDIKDSILSVKLRKKLMREVSVLALETGYHQFVHGDFHMGNVFFDGEKYGVFDLANVGKSLPEQDMTALVSEDIQNTRSMMRSYKAATGYQPDLKKLMTLHCLDLAIAAQTAHMSFQQEKSSYYLDMLQAKIT